MGSSRRDLSNDKAEHGLILKNDQNTYYLRFSFTAKTGIAFPKMGALTVSCERALSITCTVLTVRANQKCGNVLRTYLYLN